MIHIFENYFSKKKFERICKWPSDKGNVLCMGDYKFKIYMKILFVNIK